MSTNIVLLIFEGEKTEQLICQSLRQYFVDKTNQMTIQTSYGFNIYKLFKELKKDEGLTLLGIIQEELKARQKTNQSLTTDDEKVIQLEDSDEVSDIYLFFDYDPHIPGAEDQSIDTMLTKFEASTIDGKLFISYPMTEAIRHINNPDDRPLTYPTDKNALQQYKKFSGNAENIDSIFQNWGKYDLAIWSTIIKTHLKRANFLIYGIFDLPEIQLEQRKIFESQLSKYIPNHQVAVISAFPLMLHEYYDNKLWDRLN